MIVRIETSTVDGTWVTYQVGEIVGYSNLSKVSRIERNWGGFWNYTVTLEDKSHIQINGQNIIWSREWYNES